MDFDIIRQRSAKNGMTEVFPDFKICRSKDLMIRGKTFYAIYNKETGLWSTDEYDVQTLVDKDLAEYAATISDKTEGALSVKYMSQFSNQSWAKYRSYINHLSDNSKELDARLTFLNTDVKKKDYASKRLPYDMEEGPFPAWETLISTLYEPSERAKIEWAIGSILAGDSRDIQKFIVFYGEAGAGKSTILNIIQKLFEGYYTTFEAKALTSSNNAFSTEVFRGNPLVAIQHDGDLSRIEDNTKLNSIVSHEEMTMNIKYQPTYTARVNCFLFVASNKAVKITDAKSGLIRRLIDVTTSGRRLATRKYQATYAQIDFELGAIADHCLKVYRKMGKNYYDSYRPVGMIFQTDTFFNFVEDHALEFMNADGISLSRAYALYKVWCDDSELQYKLPRYKFRDEFKNYFKKFDAVTRVEGQQVRSYFSEFISSMFDIQQSEPEVETANSLVLDQTVSLLDTMCADRPAQKASRNKTPTTKWADVKTTLSDISTKSLHYVKLPGDHIVIDFDLTDDTGEKSAELNLNAAGLWPPTYAEYSQGGKGVHLHYIYTGDPDKLSGVYSEGIEIKIPRGDASLRRKLSKCNNIPVAELKGGLPLRGERVINADRIHSEIHIRRLIERNLEKEIHPGTKPSIDFIKTILDESYETEGLHYDLTTLRPRVLNFAMNSTNQGDYCIKQVAKMHFRSKDTDDILPGGEYKDDTLVFFDIEVFPNLVLVSWKYEGEGKALVHMVNPTPQEIEKIFQMKLVGFNCRRYDNHILYAIYLGYTIPEIYELSQRIINGSRNGLFREAYNISYADVYDFTSKKQSLKEYEIELGLKHNELGLPWDQPVPDKLKDKVIEYCGDDVIATEAVFKAREQDYIAREILSELSGLTVNDSTQSHTARIIFGKDSNPQSKFVYTDLSETFPGYVYEYGKSTYRGEEPGEGGYVYAEPGMYGDVALLDIASMHPASIEILNLFGPYTKNFSQLKAARLAIKHENYDAASGMLNGVLAKYLKSKEDAKALAYALKIVINIVYGLTSAKFDNKFRDKRNVDNIVAKRGALFMINLKHEVQQRGFTVVHCKTDSIKIADATPGIIDFVFEYGKEYGYDFEHEATYNKFCLVNGAVYIAKGAPDSADHPNAWTATGKQFAHPYVFKKFFSREEITFADLCETKSVKKIAMYLDLNEDLPEGEHNYKFVGKVGSFCPVISGFGGGQLLRFNDDKYYAVSGTKGFRWMESQVVEGLEKQDIIDLSYHERLATKARNKIAAYCDFDWFISDIPYIYNSD